MDIARLDKALDEAKGIPLVGELETLQGIVNTWMLRYWVFPEEVNHAELYDWYEGRLLKLYEELRLSVSDRYTHGMFASQDDPRNLLAKIHAILRSLPETAWETTWENIPKRA